MPLPRGELNRFAEHLSLNSINGKSYHNPDSFSPMQHSTIKLFLFPFLDDVYQYTVLCSANRCKSSIFKQPALRIIKPTQINPASPIFSAAPWPWRCCALLSATRRHGGHSRPTAAAHGGADWWLTNGSTVNKTCDYTWMIGTYPNENIIYNYTYIYNGRYRDLQSTD